MYDICDESQAARAWWSHHALVNDLVFTMAARRKAKDKATHHQLTRRMKSLNAAVGEARRTCRMMGVSVKSK